MFLKYIHQNYQNATSYYEQNRIGYAGKEMLQALQKLGIGKPPAPPEQSCELVPASFNVNTTQKRVHFCYGGVKVNPRVSTQYKSSKWVYTDFVQLKTSGERHSVNQDAFEQARKQAQSGAGNNQPTSRVYQARQQQYNEQVARAQQSSSFARAQQPQARAVGASAGTGASSGASGRGSSGGGAQSTPPPRAGSCGGGYQPGILKKGDVVPDTGSLKAHSMSNFEVREWYHKEAAKIPNLIDNTLSKREQGLQAFELRNKIKLQARDLMADREKAAELKSVQTLKETMQKAYCRDGKTGDDACDFFISGAQRTNPKVDAVFNLQNPNNSGRKTP